MPQVSVQRLFAFGSAIREDFRPGESDVDLLVEFAPIGGHAKFHAYFEMLDELQRELGTKVDLVMSGAVRNAIISRAAHQHHRLGDRCDNSKGSGAPVWITRQVTARPDSDVDRLITVPDHWLAGRDRVRELGALWRQYSSHRLPLDLLLYSESEIS